MMDIEIGLIVLLSIEICPEIKQAVCNFVRVSIKLKGELIYRRFVKILDIFKLNIIVVN